MSLTLSELVRNKKKYWALAFLGLFFFLASGLSLLNGSKSFIIVFTMMYGEWVAARSGLLALFAAYPTLLARTNQLYYVAIAIALPAMAGLLLMPQYIVTWMLLCHMVGAWVVVMAQVRHLTEPPSSSLVC